MAIDKKYWKRYSEFWDDFVKHWFLSGANPRDSVSELYREVVDFNADELPEPYLGNPEFGVDAVFLNLNPGMSVNGKYGAFKGKNLEATKFFSNINAPAGWLIREFKDIANCSYKDFVARRSSLDPKLRGHEFEVCGVDWWQGNNPEKVTGRMTWVRQIYGNDELCPSRVFAPEICPFHSPKFPTNGLQKLTGFIGEHVIVPAAVAVIENDLPFAVAVGKSYVNVLTNIGAQLENAWSSSAPVNEWPKKNNGDYKKRTYKLYSLTVDCVGCARFLVTYAQGGNNPPCGEFKPVEAAIRRYIVRK